MKRILIYNWIPFDETEGKGGGVTVYTNNLISYLIKQKEWDIYFLSSGGVYDINCSHTYIESTNNVFGGLCKSFQVVNSPVLASAKLNFPYAWTCYQDRSMKAVIGKFFRDVGGFEVVHFQNLEGLSLSVLELKAEFPETKFIYSLHNYYLFCPQVMLWKEDSELCEERECGLCCVACMPKDVHRRKVIFNQWLTFQRKKGKCTATLWRIFQGLVERGFSVYDKCKAGKVTQTQQKQLAETFQMFQKKNIEYVNKYVDDVLAVSKRVKELAVHYGIREKKVKVCYIGTEVADQQIGYNMYPYDGGIFHICYLGYMRKIKGFFFLIDALEHLPDIMAAKLKLTLAVKITDEKVMKRVLRLKERMHDIAIYDGYSHKELPRILEGVNLGIVPHLWEDNLPQVAIEMKAHGIPILVSHLGGAKELTLSDNFVFHAGNTEEFINKLRTFIEAPTLLDSYWDNAPGLTTMEMHVEDLMKYYYIKGEWNGRFNQYRGSSV